jgi:hypothetical protein
VNRAARLRPLVVLCALSLGIVSFAACGSSSKSGSEPSTTTSNRSLSVDTPEGQATLALNGALPPGWPTGVPVPGGSTPKGSGSLSTDTHDLMIGVYTSSTSPRDAFDFYTSNANLTVKTKRSVGIGSAFLGQLELGGAHTGTNVVIIPGGDGSYIVISIKPAGSASTTTSLR